MTMEQWIEENRDTLKNAYNGSDCMAGELAPRFNMRFDVFCAGRYEQEQRRLKGEGQ